MGILIINSSGGTFLGMWHNGIAFEMGLVGLWPQGMRSTATPNCCSQTKMTAPIRQAPQL